MASDIGTNLPELDLSDIFDAFAKKAVAEFPKLGNKFAIYNAPADTLHGSFPTEMHQQLRALQQNKVDEFLQKNASRPTAFATSAEDYYFIDYIEKHQQRHNYRTNSDPYEREVSANMEHELAHLVAPAAAVTASGHSENFRECIADAFSFLRQQQQHGSISGQIDVACYTVASIMALSGIPSTTHYCVPVLREVARIAAAYDLTDMTPAQTANMAYRLALLYAPTNPDLRKLEAAFRPVMLASKSSWGEFEACAKVMLEDHGEDSDKIFAAGKAFLTPFLDKRMDILSTSGYEESFFQRFDSPYWDSVREKIKERTRQQETTTLEQRLEQEARDMMVFGRFDLDKNPDKIIQFPLMYERQEYASYLQQARKAYTALRYLQETGKPLPGSNLSAASVHEAAVLDQNGIIELACKIAKEPMPRPVPVPPSPNY